MTEKISLQTYLGKVLATWDADRDQMGGLLTTFFESRVPQFPNWTNAQMKCISEYMLTVQNNDIGLYQVATSWDEYMDQMNEIYEDIAEDYAHIDGDSTERERDELRREFISQCVKVCQDTCLRSKFGHGSGLTLVSLQGGYEKVLNKVEVEN
jgi:hypothetical protein